LPGPTEDAVTVSLALKGTAVEGGPIYETVQSAIKFTITYVELGPPVVYGDLATVNFALVPSGIEIKEGQNVDAVTIPLKFTFSADEVAPPVITVDVGTINLLFDFGADDCHSILTPHWDVFISQRWGTGIPHQRWSITAVQNRWALWVIGVAIDNPCPEPEFASEVFAGDAA
jgi:hypothetical protein